MRRQHVFANASTTAPPHTVWQLVSDVHTWRTWGPFEESGLERPGDAEEQGTGAIRRFVKGSYVTRELVVTFEPDEHLVYQLLSGLPLRGYEGAITLVPTPSGTAISWTSTFEPAIPGTGRLFARGMQRLLQDLVTRLAGAAAAAAGAPTDADRPAVAERRSA